MTVSSVIFPISEKEAYEDFLKKWLNLSSTGELTEKIKRYGEVVWQLYASFLKWERLGFLFKTKHGLPNYLKKWIIIATLDNLLLGTEFKYIFLHHKLRNNICPH